MTEVEKDFSRDLETGEKYERLMCEVVLRQGYTNPMMTEGYFPDYDIKTGEATFEVKADSMAETTGNYFIELKCAGKWSGISVTKATFFVVVDPAQGYAHVAPTDNVREFIKQNWQYLEKKNGVGDDGNVSGILVPKFLYTSTRIAGLKVWELYEKSRNKQA